MNWMFFLCIITTKHSTSHKVFQFPDTIGKYPSPYIQNLAYLSLHLPLPLTRAHRCSEQKPQHASGQVLARCTRSRRPYNTLAQPAGGEALHSLCRQRCAGRHPWSRQSYIYQEWPNAVPSCSLPAYCSGVSRWWVNLWFIQVSIIKKIETRKSWSI